MKTKSKTPIRDEFLVVKLKKSEKEFIASCAEAEGMTISAFVREAINEHIRKAKGEQK